MHGHTLISQHQDLSTCCPLRIYGDGAEAQQHFELISILPVLACGHNTLDTRLVCAVRNSQKTTTAARHQILIVLAWSFEALRSLVVNLNPLTIFNLYSPLSMGEIAKQKRVLDNALKKVWGYIHIKIRGVCHFRRRIILNDMPKQAQP